MKVCVIECSACGGPKMAPSKSAYLYCDFCGRYLDWDFYRAVSSKEDRLPGPEYERLAAELAPEAEAARARGDREGYAAVQKRLFEAHMTACPASYSPRIGDESYRAAMLDYMARYYTLTAFDEELVQLNAALTRATNELEWRERGGEAFEGLSDSLEDYRDLIAVAAAAFACTSASFWRMFDAFDAFTRRAFDKASEQGLFRDYPDDIDERRAGRTAYSALAEAWLPYLDDADQKRLLERTGLATRYREVDPSELTERHCGRCGGTLAVPHGARRVLCESCGHHADVQRPEIACGQCGGPVSMPDGLSHVSCPYCGAEIRALV